MLFRCCCHCVGRCCVCFFSSHAAAVVFVSAVYRDFLLAYQGDTFVRQSVTIRQIFHRYLPHYQPSQGKHMGSKRM